ncbi:hypothetical protein JHD49_02385 [Sulfurimonas sp. SAG-AH-194-C21]|nr:hypothetical protein [Sulfurimonas sp. SAG-AH-194-C21]MDF1882780.1 hypothetical protein [Sulfurimonas sp. SAG-AH-194-C21]
MLNLKHLLIFSLFLVTLLEARMDRYDERGFRVYLQYCKECHRDPYTMADRMKSKKWKKAFANDGKKLITFHKGDDARVRKVLKRKSKTKHLRKFLMQSASDSGVVIGCDGNYCGH